MFVSRDAGMGRLVEEALEILEKDEKKVEVRVVQAPLFEEMYEVGEGPGEEELPQFEMDLEKTALVLHSSGTCTLVSLEAFRRN